LTDSDGRLLSLLIDLNGFKLNLVNIYAPNAVSDCQVFFSHLHDYFLSQGDLVIGGDFNCVDNVLDELNCSVVPLSDQKLLCSLRADLSLTDIWRKRNPHGFVFTWLNSDHMQAFRIDHFLAERLFAVIFCLVFYPTMTSLKSNLLLVLLSAVLAFGGLIICCFLMLNFEEFCLRQLPNLNLRSLISLLCESDGIT